MLRYFCVCCIYSRFVLKRKALSWIFRFFIVLVMLVVVVYFLFNLSIIIIAGEFMHNHFLSLEVFLIGVSVIPSLFLTYLYPSGFLDLKKCDGEKNEQKKDSALHYEI